MLPFPCLTILELDCKNAPIARLLLTRPFSSFPCIGNFAAHPIKSKIQGRSYR